MIEEKSKASKAFDIFNVIFLCFMIVITLYPFYYVLVCSFSDSSLLMMKRGIVLWPQGFSMAAYKAVFSNPNIFTGYRTTLIVVIFGTILNVLLTAIGAFLITRRKFRLRKSLEYIMIFTMYFSGGMIPTYIIVYNVLKLGDTLWALLLPTAISTYNLLIMKSNFMSIPDSLEESAKLDGANDIIILFRIILPLSTSIMAVMVLFYGVGHWNSWFQALLYIRTRDKYPLQLILREILLINSASSMADSDNAYMLSETIKYATIMVATVPILCVYPFIQKYFVKGIMLGAVKG